MSAWRVENAGEILSARLNRTIAREHMGHEDLETLFSWEIAHRSDKHRRRRKIQQLLVDEITSLFRD